MNTDADLIAAIRSIIERIAGPIRTPPNIGPETPLADGFWLDSIELLEVIVACEVEFGIVFDDARDRQSGMFETLGTLTDLIRNKRASSRHGP